MQKDSEWPCFWPALTFPTLSFTLLALGLALSGGVSRAHGQELETTTEREISAIMAEKAARTEAQHRIDSQLWYSLRQRKFGSAVAEAHQLRSRLASPLGDRVLVDITAPVTPNIIREISRVGGRVVNAFAQHQAIRAELPTLALESIASQPGVRSVRAADEYTLNSVGTLMEGVVAHRVSDARVAFPADGTGVKIGVLSDSLDHLAELQQAGLLPQVTVLPGQSGGTGTGEGTAMLQIVHSMAPGANLVFATAMGGMAAFAENIRALQAAGCKVIVDDVLYFSESPFQDGPVAQAIREVTSKGAMYFAAAGNSGTSARNTGATWEGDFKDAGPVSYSKLGTSVVGRIHDFGGTNANLVLPSVGVGRVDLFWADPLGKAVNDYDLYVIDSAGSVVAASTDIQNGTQDPWEKLPNISSGQRIVVVKYAGKERYLHLNTGRAYLKQATPGAIRGHNGVDAPNAFSVAAAQLPSPLAAFRAAPFNPTESYSSDGPRRIFFNPDGSAITPNNFLASGGRVVRKPDLAAAAGVTTAVPGFAPFHGTSAAAPHAAALAALVWSHRPGLTASEVSQVLRATALDVDTPGVDDFSGVGVAMGYEALAYDQPSLKIQAMELRDGNGSGTLDPNECADLLITLINEAAPDRQTALDLTGILQSSVPGLYIDPAPRVYGDLPADGVTTLTATFKLSTTGAYPCGTRIPLLLQAEMSNPLSVALPFYLDPLAAGFGAAQRFSGTGLPSPVPDPGTLNSPVQVTGFTNRVAKVQVGVHITHPYIADLNLVLQGPDGTQSVLSLNNGTSGNNFGLGCDQPAIFTDEASRNIATADPPYVGELAPKSPLAVFVGKTGNGVNGTWTLKVQDQFEPDSGILQCWWLGLSPNVCSPGNGQCLIPPSVVTAPANLLLTNGNNGSFSVSVQGTEPLTYRWYFNTTNLLAVAGSPTLQLQNVTPANEGLYTVSVSNPYGSVSASARLSVVVRPTIACAPERTVPIGGSWTLMPPSATGTNVSVRLVNSVTNSGPCGASHTVLFNWEAKDAAGYTATCVQTVHFTDTQPPVVNCSPEKTVPLGGNWAFDLPSAHDAGDAEQTGYDAISGALLGALDPATLELGDEITLAGAGRAALAFELKYTGTNQAGLGLSGTASAQLKFYQNDGPAVDGGPQQPGTLLYDSGPLPVAQAENGSVIVTDFSTGAVLPLTQPLPDRFTWTIQFAGLAADDRVTLPVRAPGAAGSHAAWYWARSSGTWGLNTNATAGGFAASLKTLVYPLAASVVSTVTNTGCEAGYQVTRTWEFVDPCGNAAQCSQTVNVLDTAPPAITAQPEDVEVVQGKTVSFSVAAGPCGPLTYQWYKNATNALARGTNDTLFLTNVTSSAAGAYSVVVSAPYSSVTSSVARLTVYVPARITTEPVDAQALEGQSVQFTVKAAGTSPLTYRWYFNKTNLLGGVTGNTLEIPAVSPSLEGAYSVVVSNAWGKDTSRSAILSLAYPPVFLTSLSDTLATNGQNLTLAVSAEGAQPLGYSWYFNETNLLDGYTNASVVLTNVTPAQAGLYSVTVSNIHGQVTSRAIVTVVELPVITSPPAPQLLNAGESATFSVVAGGSEPLSYQWFAPNGAALTDETNSVLSLPGVTVEMGGFYSVIVSNPYGGASASGELRVLGPPVVISGPDGVTVTNGAIASLSVNVQGTEPMSYTWFRDGKLLSGYDSPQIVFNPVTPANAGSYAVFVSNPRGSTMSGSAVVSVIAPAAIVSEPQDLVVTNEMEATFTAGVVGQAPLSLQWYFNETNALPGATSATFTLPAARPEDAGVYTLVVSNVYNVVTSAPVQLLVVLPLELVSQPASLAVNRGSPAEFLVEAAGTGPITYQWYRTGGQQIPSANAARLAFAAVQLSDAGSYYVVVSNPFGSSTSEIAGLTVIAPPELGGPASVVATNGDDVKFTANAIGSAPLRYQWYHDELPLQAGTNDVLELSNVTVPDAGTYTVVVTNDYGAATNSATLTVRVELTIACAPPRTVEVGQDWDFIAPEVNGLGVVVTAVSTETNHSCGGTYTATRVWEARDLDNDSLSCSEVVTVVDTIPPVAEPPVSKTVVLGDAWDFDVPSGQDLGGVVTVSVLSTVTNVTCGAGFAAIRTWTLSDACENATQVSQTVTVEDRTPPVITSAPMAGEVLESASVTLVAEAAGCGPFGYQWYFNETNALAGETGAALILAAVTEASTGLYSVTVSNLYGTVTSPTAQVTVRVPAQIVGGPASVAVEAGNDAVFSVSLRGTEPLFVQWFFNDTQPLPGATDTTLTLSQVQTSQAGTYTVVVTNAWGATRRSAMLDVLLPAQILVEPEDRSVPVGATVSFSVSATGNPSPQYQWYFNGNPLPGATQPTLTIVNTRADQAGDYAVFVSNSVSSLWSRTAVLSLTEAPVMVEQPASISVFKGSTAQFTALAAGAPPLAYQWFFNGTNLLAGANSPQLVLPNVDVAQSGEYSVVVTNLSGRVVSNPATLRVLVVPQVTSVTKSNSLVTITITTETNLYYTVYYSSNLTQTSGWPALPKAIRRLGTGVPMKVEDAQAVDTRRFYSIVVE